MDKGSLPVTDTKDGILQKLAKSRRIADRHSHMPAHRQVHPMMVGWINIDQLEGRLPEERNIEKKNQEQNKEIEQE